jgi:hypothetical protein
MGCGCGGKKAGGNAAGAKKYRVVLLDGTTKTYLLQRDAEKAPNRDKTKPIEIVRA